ncbi:MAG: PAS-domain containing protein [Rhodocyclaceae bacterium]|nr:PAS-domain containing protein [Rhodocyclaceae bacterium]
MQEPTLLDEHRRLEMLQAGLDLLNQGITVFDADLHMVAWNSTFLRLLEFPSELASIGADFESFIRYNAERGEYGPGDPDQQVAERVLAARGFQPHYTERTRPDGRMLAVRGEPLPYKGFVTLYTDITAQRRYEKLIRRQNADLEERVRERTAELQSANTRLTDANEANEQIAAALARSEERMRLISNNVPAMIGYFDRNEIFRYGNRGYELWCGHDVIAGMTTAEVVGHQVYSIVRGHVQTALGGRQVTYEYHKERPNGEIAYARSTLVPEFSADGEVLGCFVLSIDITEQRRTQAALAQAQKMEAIGQLSGGIAHDFNNILTVVIGNLSVLQSRTGPEAQEFLAPALAAARRGVEMIRRLLTFSRQQPLLPRPVDVGALIGELTRLLRRSLPENIEICVTTDSAPLYAMTDPNQLESALLNLALNARDAMPGGGRLQITAGSRPIDADEAAKRELTPGDYLNISVRDNGTGMDEATLARVFEPFFTTKAFGSGSGLGMPMVYGFVKQSGGTILLDSRPGAGTTVALLLPVAARDALQLEAGPAQPAPAPGLAGKLVLLVEDNAEVRRIARLLLTELGHPVLEAENGEEAAAMIDDIEDIAVVLTDVVMPGGLDGIALARHAASARPGLPVLLMSGYAESAVRAGDTGGIPLLPKPFTRDELAAALAKVAP